MLRSGCAFSATTVSRRRSASRAAWDMLWLAAGSATRSGTSPLAATSGDAETPPVSAITGEPIRPWKSMPTAVSARTGVLRSMTTVACTCRGLAGSSARAVTSPTRMPLKCTAEPRSSPETEFSKRMR